MPSDPEARIAELEADLAECHRLRLCENQATARAIEAMREAKEEAKRYDAQAEYFAGILADISIALGLALEVPTNRIMSKIRELRKAAKDEGQGTDSSA